MRYFTTLLFLIISSVLFAQNNYDNITNTQLGYDYITEKRVEYLSSRMSFTPTEAQQFWPLFKEYQQKRVALNTNKTNLKRVSPDISEEESLKLGNAFISYKLTEAKLLEEYHNKYLNILSAKKVLELYKYNDEFNKQLLKQLKQANKNKR